MERQTFCRVCNAMCGLVVNVEEGRIGKIRGDSDHALSRGYSCPKGRALGDLHHDERRLDTPLLRAGSELTSTTWPDVVEDIATRLASSISEQGPDSIAMYLASGSAFDTAGRRAAERFLTLLGSPQKYTATTIDTPSKPLVAELVGGWSGLTPVWDETSSRLLVLFGSNPVVSHGHSNAMPDPVRRLREFGERGGELWVIDPRRTETAALADHHLQCAPGSDWMLMGWLVRRLIIEHPAASSLHQRASGAEELRTAVEVFDDDLVTTSTHLSIEQLEDLLVAILSAGRVSALTGTGVSMSATANIAEYLLWALHIVTDSYDAPGGMWFNPGYLSQLDQRSLTISDGVPGPGPRSRPNAPRRFGEFPCSALIPEIEAGNVTTLIVVGGNPMTAFPDHHRTATALASLQSLIVIDILPTETTEIATHVLPAVDQLERADLTWLLDSYQLAVAAQFTNAIVEPLGDRKPVWWMFGAIAERLGLQLLPGTLELDVATDEALLQPLLTRSRNADALHDSPTLVVASGATFGWVSSSVLPNGRWRLEARPILDQLENVIERTRRSTGDGPSLIPHRRLRMMNSQFLELDDASDDTTDAVRVSPSLGEELGRPRHVRLSTATASITAPLIIDDRLHDNCVTLSHGIGRTNVSLLTSADDDIDPLTGMVLQSGIDVTISAVD